MARTPTRLFGPALLSGSPATKYTTPAVTKTIIRHMHFSNPSGSAATITVSLGTDAAGKRLFDGYSLGAGAILDHFCYYVLEATEIIQAFSGTASVIVMIMNGDEYTLG